MTGNNGMHRWLDTPASRSRCGWTVLRLTVAGLIAAHGWSRLVTGGVVPFGDWLESQGIPFGLAIAGTITALEIVGTLPFAFRRLVVPLSIVYSLIYVAGIVMVHAREGWFVVGHGRNGMEFSVLLIVSLVVIGVQDLRIGDTGTGRE